MDTADRTSRERPDIEQILGVGKSAGRSWFGGWRAVMVAVVVIAAGAAGYLMWKGGGSGNVVRYVTEEATRGNLTIIVTATGSVQPLNEVNISSELSGTVRKVLVDYNSKVAAGQTLAELDTDKLQATVESSRAKLIAAQARVKDAEATLAEKEVDFARKERLVARKVISEQDLESARAAHLRSVAAVESAKADVVAAEADLKLNETNLAKACICSPIDGVVLLRNVEPGQTVASNLQAPVLFTLAEDLAKMRVQVDVDEADVGQVREGQSATFTVDAYPDRTFSARIRELRYGSETVQGVVTYKAVLETDNADLLLRPGMTATAEIVVREVTDAIRIPNAALRYTAEPQQAVDTRSFIQKFLPGPPRLNGFKTPVATGPNRTIWVLDGGAAKPVEVVVGSSDGRLTELIEGDIAAGAAVIVDRIESGT